MWREDSKQGAATPIADEQKNTPPEATEAPADAPAPTVKPRKPRGFATMDSTRVRELARRGGTTAHAKGTAHEFTPAEAKEAGRKGGIAAHAKRRAAREQSPPQT